MYNYNYIVSHASMDHVFSHNITGQGAQLQLILSATEVSVGDQLNITCVASNPTVPVGLVLNGATFATSGGRFTFITSGEVTTWAFNSVRPEDEGEYACITHTESSDKHSEPQYVVVNCEFQLHTHVLHGMHVTFE